MTRTRVERFEDDPDIQRHILTPGAYALSFHGVAGAEP